MNREERRAFARQNGVPMPPAEPQATLNLGPVPVSTGIIVTETSDGPRVVLQFQTPQGFNAFFLSVEHAREMVDQLGQALTAATSGLVIAKDIPQP